MSVSWKLVGDRDVVEFTVTSTKTTGYVSFGFSTSGSMKGMEVYTFLPEENVLQAMTSYDFVKPEVRDQVTPESTRVDESGSTFTFRRSKCSLYDSKFDFPEHVIYFIFSSGFTTAEGEITYHGTNRGTKTAFIYSGPDTFERPDVSDDKIEKIRSASRVVPSDPDEHNSFQCTWINTPEAASFKPGSERCPDFEDPSTCEMPETRTWNAVEHYLSQNGRLVHHMILNACPAKMTYYWDSLHVHPEYSFLIDEGVTFNENQPFECSQAMPPCQTQVGIWAVGNEGMRFFNGEGISSDAMTFVLQIHYYNPQAEPNLVDSSGFDLFLDESVVTHQSMAFFGGPIENIAIPANTDDYLMRTVSAPAWSKYFFSKPHYLTSVMTHSHNFGKSHSLRILKQDGTLISVLDQYYDYNHQLFRKLEPRVVVEPGDILEFDCVFKNERDTVVYGGEGTDDEMCFGLLTFMPVDGINDVGRVGDVAGFFGQQTWSDPKRHTRWIRNDEGQYHPMFWWWPYVLQNETFEELMDHYKEAEDLGIQYVQMDMSMHVPNFASDPSEIAGTEAGDRAIAYAKQHVEAFNARFGNGTVTMDDFVVTWPEDLLQPVSQCERVRSRETDNEASSTSQIAGVTTLLLAVLALF